MPGAPKGPLWAYFWEGPKQNQSQKKAYCYGCIAANRPPDAALTVTEGGTIEYFAGLRQEEWFRDGMQAN